MRRLIFAGASAALSLPAGAAEIVCGREITSFEQAASELASDKRLVAIPNGGADFAAYKDERDGGLRQWYVTKPHYRDIKAVICRGLEQERGRFFIKVEASCFGAKPLCDRLVNAFKAN